jgi:hypothetical protein
MVTDEQLAQVLAEIAYNSLAYQAGITLLHDSEAVRRGTLVLKPGGGEVLSEALEAALHQLEIDNALVEFVLSEDYREGFVLGYGPVGHVSAFLATVEVAYAKWVMRRSGIRFTICDYYDMPENFQGDLRDVAGAIMGWTLGG